MSAAVRDAELADRQERRFLLLAGACVLVFGLLYLLAVRTGWGQSIDNATLAGRTARPEVLRATDRLLNTISISALVLVGAVVVLIALVRGRPHLALTALVLVGGANFTTQILKHWVLPRPTLVDPDPLGPSFPSGHSTVALSLGLAVVLVVPHRARVVAALGAFGYASLVGIGVVTAGWHRPSDVVGAYLVTTTWAALSAAFLLAWQGTTRVRTPRQSLEPLVPPILAGGGLAFLVVGFVGLAATLVAIREDQLDAVRLDEAYAAALVAIVGSCLLLVGALLAAMRGVNLDPPDDVPAEPAGAPAPRPARTAPSPRGSR